MQSALRISEAAGLALHSVTALARERSGTPMKIGRLARMLNASEAHLGKVLHRLARARIVTSRRGPTGGFVLDPSAAAVTLLELYEMFDGPLDHGACLLGFPRCPFGGCALGDTLQVASDHLLRSLQSTRLGDLAHGASPAALTPPTEDAPATRRAQARSTAPGRPPTARRPAPDATPSRRTKKARPAATRRQAGQGRARRAAGEEI